MVVNEDNKEKLAPLLEFYKEQCSHGRHIESQRQAACTLLLTAGGALIALMGTLKFSIHCAPIACLLFALGWFGKRFVQVYELKWEESSERRNYYREAIETVTGISNPQVARAPGTLRKFWRGTFDGLIFTGVLCLLIVIAVVWVRGSNSKGPWLERIKQQVSVGGDAAAPSDSASLNSQRSQSPAK
jgi:hypothetical protein